MAIIPMHINGPAKVDIDFNAEDLVFTGVDKGTVGEAVLGFTEEGVDVKITIGTFEWFTDQNSTVMPGAVLYTGQVADIELILIRWNESVLDIASRVLLGIGTTGTASSNTKIIGRQIFSAEAEDKAETIEGVNRTSKLIIVSTARTGLPTEKRYEFPNAYMMGTQEFTLGTRVTKMKVQFRCLAQDQVSEGRVYDKL